MRQIVEELERLAGELNTADPGDLGQMRDIVTRRAHWVAELGRVTSQGYHGDDAGELAERLRALSQGGLKTYRRVMLQKLLIQQQLRNLRQERIALQAFDPGGTTPETGSLVKTLL